jgi:hypothetical protein
MGMLPKFNLARWFGNRLGTKPARKGKRQATSLKPQLLCLEERITPTTYTVTNFGNSSARGTLRDCIDKANNTKADDIIVFDIGSSARTINLESQLPNIEARGTAGKLSIEGPGRTALTLNGNDGDSNRDFRIFNILDDADFTLRGVTISGARANGSGAAIYNRGGTVSISSSTLTSNTSGEWGGAIRNDEGRMDVSYCTISKNKADNGGGISNHFGGTLILNNSTLSGNTAIDDGGGIFSQSSYALVSYSSVVKENIAGRDGAGICNNFGTVNIGNGKNIATISGNTAGTNGGGISNNGGRANITSSNISGNYAGDSGGGVFNKGNGYLTVSGSIITGNSVTKNNGVGGGISSDINNGSVIITNSEISYNHADGGLGDGGGIYSDGNTILTIQGGSTISNNTAGRDGGGIYSNGLSLEINSSTVSYNEADHDAGGIYSWHESTLAVNNSTIKYNTSDGDGGGIFIDVGAGNYNSSVDNEIFYSRIEGNEARSGGGIFNNGSLMVYGSTIDSNIAKEINRNNLREGCGGGILSGIQGQLFVYDCTISNNKADINGGGIAAYRPAGVTNIPIPGQYGRILKAITLGVNYIIDQFTPPEPFTIYNSTIAYNQAGIKRSQEGENYNGFVAREAYGGGIFTICETGIFNCTIAYNSTYEGRVNVGDGYFGGGLARGNYASNTTSLLTIENTIIVENTGKDYSAQNATKGSGFSAITRVCGAITRLIVSDDSFNDIAGDNQSIIPIFNAYYTYLPPENQFNLVHSGQAFGDGDDIDFIIVPAHHEHLGPLQDNGGPTFTMALLEHSPAIDKGAAPLSNNALDFANVIYRDQRGNGRVPTTGGVVYVVDIGAFEYQPLATTAKLVTSTQSHSGTTHLSTVDPVTHEQIDYDDPFPGFTGEIHIASGDYNGDFNGDGIGDIVVGAGEGGGPAVAIIDSQTGHVIAEFFAFDPAFRGGIDVATLDANLDGVMDIIVGAGHGGGPHVKIFNGKDLSLLFSFYAYANNFTGGVSICALDVNDDGIRDLVTGAGVGGAPHVRVWDGATHTLLSEWFAYDPAFRGGVNVSGGYLGSDGTVMVVTGAGAGMAPEVAVWNPLTGAEISRFLAYDSNFTGGVHVGVADVNGDGVSELITGTGKGGSPHVKGFSFPSLDMLFEYFAGDPTDTDGVFVS